MSQNYLASRSSNLSSFNAIAMNYSTLTVSTLSGVSTLNVSRVITTSTIQVNSSMISLGASTNQVYISSLSYGNFSTATTWVTSLTNRLSTATVAMSANAQYQMTVSPSTTVSSIMYTSTLGSSWTTISAATGLPSATATSYTAGAISGDGQYAALGAYGGYLYRTANSGATWTNTNPNTGSLYAQLAFEGNANDVSGNGRTVNTSGSPGYVTGIVGTRAINLVNASAAVQTQTVTISWTGATNFTISGWFNAQSVWPTIYNTNIFSAYNGSFALTIGPSIDSRLLRWYIPSGGSNNVQQVTNSLTIALNTWYNYTAIFQTGGLCSLYLNNVLVGSYTNTSGVGSYTTTSIVLGGYDLPHDPGNSFNGYMDDFKVYNSAITFTPMVPQNWSNVAVSNTGQYMLATATGAGLYMSSNFGSTWTQVTGAMLSAIWSAAQVSASGQYMLAYSTPIILQPQLTGLTGNNTTSTPVATSWQTGGITWTSNSSSVVGATFQSWCAFNNVVPPNSSSPSYSWASAATYSSGAYTGSVSTTIISPGPGAYTGEWIQIQSPAPIVIYSYNFACGGIGNIPKTYYIVGSNDGSTWYPIQLVSIGTNPFTAGFTSATSSPIIVNQSGSQTMTAGTSGTLTCTTYTTNTTAAYTYFRFIANSVFSTGANFEFTELYLNFQAGAGGQTYSTNYGATWNNGYALPTPTALSLSGSGQYAIGANNSVPSAPVVYVTNNFLQGFSTGTFTTPNFTTLLNAETNVPVASAVSNTGQYMVLITNNISGNNVYYSTNFGALFTSLQLGTTLLTSCAISYDGSYITVSNATTTWTLNNNSNGFSVALGNQAGYQNQGQNAIAIGNGAGSINQTANSIILNASGAAVNSFAPGFYVAPIATYVASSSGSYNLLGYGTDNQVVQTGFILSNNYSKITRTTTQLLQLVGDNISSIYMGLNEIKITGNGASHWSIFGARTDNNHNYFSITNTSNNMSPGTLGTDVLTILDNGNVGIGKTNPAYTLDVNGTINATNTIFATNPIALWMPANGGSSLFITDSQSSPSSGTTTYGRYFGVSGVIYQDFFNLFQWRGCNNAAGGLSNANAMSLSSGGNLYVSGYVNTNGSFNNGGIYFTGDIPAAQWQICLIGAQRLGFKINQTGIDGPGGYTAVGAINSAGSYSAISDMRLKNTIEPITSGLSSILQLKPSTFFYNDTTQKFAGFIAQDVLPILPLAIEMNKIRDNDDTEYYYLNQTMIIPYTVKAIQEQHEIIQQQTLEINELKAQLTAITQRLAAANIA